MRSRFHHGSYHGRPLDASRRFVDGPSKGDAVSDEQASPPLTGRARSLANLKRNPKGVSGNPSGRPKNLARFGDIVMREFFKTAPASLGGKTVNKMQGEIVAMQMIKQAINKGGHATNLLLKFIEAREAREAKREELLLRKKLDGSVEIDWDDEKEQLYQRVVRAMSDDEQVHLSAPQDE